MFKKRVLSLALACIIGLSLFTPVAADTTESNAQDSTVQEETTTVSSEEAALFESQQFKDAMTFLIILNTERVEKGLTPISVSEDALNAMQLRATELESDYSHTRPDGNSWSTILSEYGLLLDAENTSLYNGYEFIATKATNAAEAYEILIDEYSSVFYRNDLSIMGMAHTDGTVYNEKTKEDEENPWAGLLLGKHTAYEMELATTLEDVYPAGRTLTDMGMILRLYVRSPEGAESITYMPLIQAMAEGYSASKTGTQTVKITYKDTTLKKKNKQTVTFDITTKKGEKPATPDNFSATGTSYNKVTVNWSPVDNVNEYQLYRSTKKGSGYKKVATLKPRKLTLSEEGLYTYIDTTVSNGVKYYYKLKAVNGSVSSSYTQVDEALPNIKAPSNVKCTSKGKNSIKISWSKVSKATSYRVYYCTSENGKYKRATSPSTKKRTYTIKKLKSKTTYYIKLLAYRNGRPSSYSKILKVKTK